MFDHTSSLVNQFNTYFKSQFLNNSKAEVIKRRIVVSYYGEPLLLIIPLKGKYKGYFQVYESKLVDNELFNLYCLKASLDKYSLTEVVRVWLKTNSNQAQTLPRIRDLMQRVDNAIPF